MRDCELNRIEVGEHEDQSDQVEGAMGCEFEALKILQELEENKPIKGYNRIKAQFEKTICFLQLFPLLLGWVDQIECEKFIQIWQQQIDDEHHDPGVGPDGGIGES